MLSFYILNVIFPCLVHKTVAQMLRELQQTEDCIRSNKIDGFGYCLKQQFIKILENVDDTGNFSVMNGVTLEKDVSDMARILPHSNVETYSPDMR